MKETTYKLIWAEVVKETEKAYQMKCTVTWGSRDIEKLIWFPKSVVKIVEDKLAEVALWFLLKVENENVFHGYEMRFVDPYALSHIA